jgi:citrate synthase
MVAEDKPFITILNSLNIFSKYIREIFKGNEEHLQIVYPSNKIHFNKLTQDGTTEYKPNTSFYCVYVAYKMNIPPKNLMLQA